MANNELLEYRIINLETELDNIIEASHEMTKTISSLVMQLGTINENLNKMIDVSSKLTERITVLESDLSERTLRKKIYKSLVTFYPLLILSLMLIFNLDHHKIIEVLSEIKMLMPKIN